MLSIIPHIMMVTFAGTLEVTSLSLLLPSLSWAFVDAAEETEDLLQHTVPKLSIYHLQIYAE